MAKQQENKEIIKFKIDQLRKDKMIYALESIALTFIVELSYLLLSLLFIGNYSPLLALFALLLPLSYFIYMMIGNLIRLNKIKKLEKELYNK
jgi:hypothetical protein